jgi:hypothetical protein
MAFWVFAGGALALVVGSVVILRRRAGQPPGNSSPGTSFLAKSLGRGAAARPSAIVIGGDSDRAAIKIAALTDIERFQRARPYEASHNEIAKLNVLFQAVPAILVDGAHHGRKIMEVVINGDLIRTVDGNGFRALAVDAGGKFSEHARLFEVDRLQDLVNAAAIWQIASVIVAQKHLADISAKLTTISKQLDKLASRLSAHRRSRISSALDYLSQLAQAFRAGEIAPSARTMIEAREVDLLGVQKELMDELRSSLADPVKHTEWLGTSQLRDDLRKRYHALEEPIADITLCIQARILCWHVFSLVPGEPQLKVARKNSILVSIQDLSDFRQQVASVLAEDADRFKSRVNRTETLIERKSELESIGSAMDRTLEEADSGGKNMIDDTDALLLAHDQPTVLFAEVEDGRVVSIRESLPVPAEVRA